MAATNMTTNGHHYPRAERGLADAGDAPSDPKPCSMRTPGGGFCYLPDDGHTDHTGIPSSRHEYPQPAVDHHVMAKVREAKPPKPVSEVVWPTAGDRFRDSEGRVLTVTAIDPKSRTERHVVGTVDGAQYACGRRVFDEVWCAKV